MKIETFKTCKKVQVTPNTWLEFKVTETDADIAERVNKWLVAHSINPNSHYGFYYN